MSNLPTLTRGFLYVLVLIFVLGTSTTVSAQHLKRIPNPVLEEVADSGIIKYKGTYYLMGVGTEGSMYTSTDLINWKGPTHAFSMNNDWALGPAGQDRRIHASDFTYLDGTFHHYWSVNYWGEPRMTVRIGHAVADSALGPYREPVKTTWFDSRIDPHLFVDRDGTPYFYSVKFGEGNLIYGQRMADPWTRIGTPRLLLSASPNTWETRSHSINEGPEVEWYRGRYYLLYASNHVGAKWGQYAIGVSEADHPLEFNNATKYAHPVLGPTNEERLTSAARVHIPIGSSEWRYRTAPPESNGWTRRNFDDSHWAEGRAAFGSETVENSTMNRTSTNWSDEGLWLRRTIRIQERPSKHVQLLVRLRGQAEVYVNGKQVHKSNEIPYYATIDVDAVSAFRSGNNVIAVRVRQREDAPRYVDIGLLDPRTHPGESFIFSPGQPNLVRGPNGFEWWLVYFARHNGGAKSQAVDRVHFFDDKLYVDGPTGPRTPGYHPPPTPPTAQDLFENSERTALGPRWDEEGKGWIVQNGQARQERSTGVQRARINADPGTNLLFQASFRFSEAAAGRAGMVLKESDGKERLLIALDRSEDTWLYRHGQDEGQSQSFALPDDFDYEAYHQLRIMKNAGQVQVSIDGRPAPGTSNFETGLQGPVHPGLFTDETRGIFDGVTYTRGWDEYESGISGWRDPDGEGRGSWQVDTTGLRQASREGLHRVIKGELLEQYELNAQVYGTLRPPSDDTSRHMGILPVYIDRENWVRAVIRPGRHELIVEEKINGTIENRRVVELEKTTRLYPDATYSDSFSKQYTLRGPTRLDSLYVEDAVEGKPMRKPLPDSWEVEKRKDGEWQAVSPGKDPVRAEAFRIDRGTRSQEIGPLYARIRGKSTYNLRVVKRAQELIFFVDGSGLLRLPNRWSASRVGLETRGMRALFDGIQRYEIPD